MFLLLGLALTLAAPTPAVEASQYQALRYRLLGPSRGGRSTAVTGIPGRPHTFFAGSSGGLWKTDDAGMTWENVSDGFFESGSIGAVAVPEADPSVVYAGTGQACLRGNVSAGVGVYRSTDGGRTWTHAGLRDVGQIARIRIHPKDPNLLYVAAVGRAFGPNPERGVFRSKDGGKTWEKVLSISPKTGVTDLAMDAANPRVLYAAAWTGERKPWTIISGSAESGLYKSDRRRRPLGQARGRPAAGRRRQDRRRGLAGRPGPRLGPRRGRRRCRRALPVRRRGGDVEAPPDQCPPPSTSAPGTTSTSWRIPGTATALTS